jgi:hypothetical protein
MSLKTKEGTPFRSQVLYPTELRAQRYNQLKSIALNYIKRLIESSVVKPFEG